MKCGLCVLRMRVFNGPILWYFQTHAPSMFRDAWWQMSVARICSDRLFPRSFKDVQWQSWCHDMTSDPWTDCISNYSHLSDYWSPHTHNTVPLLNKMNTSNPTTPLHHFHESAPLAIPPCTLVWHAISGTIEDWNELYYMLLFTDLAVATKIQGHTHHSIKWILDKIPVPLKTGDRFWFCPVPPVQNRSITLPLGGLSTIGYFSGRYTLVETPSISHFD